MSRPCASGGRSAVAALSLLVLLGHSGAVRADPRCAAPAQVWGGFPPLERAQTRLERERRLTIVAIGSSSTEGVGATSPTASYPAQLDRLLEERFPGVPIEVVNRGVGGETVADNLGRFDRDVLAFEPALVIWQVGTNDALTGVPDLALRRQLLEGIARARASGAEIVLMDPQPVPDPERARAIDRVEAVLVATAREARVPLLSRHALMRHWLSSGQLAAASLLGPDGLHMTDVSYRCLAERVGDLLPAARAVADAS